MIFRNFYFRLIPLTFFAFALGCILLFDGLLLSDAPLDLAGAPSLDVVFLGDSSSVYYSPKDLNLKKPPAYEGANPFLFLDPSVPLQCDRPLPPRGFFPYPFDAFDCNRYVEPLGMHNFDEYFSGLLNAKYKYTYSGVGLDADWRIFPRRRNPMFTFFREMFVPFYNMNLRPGGYDKLFLCDFVPKPSATAYRELHDHFIKSGPEDPANYAMIVQMPNGTLLTVNPKMQDTLRVLEATDGAYMADAPGMQAHVRKMIAEEERWRSFVYEAPKPLGERTWYDWYVEQSWYVNVLVLIGGLYLGFCYDRDIDPRYYDSTYVPPWESTKLH